MSVRMRQFLKKQTKEDKKLAAELLNTTVQLMKSGKYDLAMKYLSKNKKKHDAKPKKSMWRRFLNLN